MKIAFVIFDGMTSLDFLGAYDPLTRLKSMGFLKNMIWEVCAPTEQVTDDRGLVFTPTQVGLSLERFDLVVVPGGFVTRQIRYEGPFIHWLQSMEPCPFKASVCSGALLLGAAGFLKGRKATTHPAARVELAEYCEKVVDQRVVEDGPVITCGGVTAGIDMGLHLCEKFAGFDVKEKIRRQMDYYG